MNVSHFFLSLLRPVYLHSQVKVPPIWEHLRLTGDLALDGYLWYLYRHPTTF